MFFKQYPREGKIFAETFEVISPRIDDEIQRIRQPFLDFNRDYFQNAIHAMELREGVDEAFAMRYFLFLQDAMNTYLMQDREQMWSEILDVVLYGIVERK